MPFSYPATELFSPEGTRRVVWSHQEFEDALAEGWSEEKPAAPPVEALADEPPAPAKPLYVKRAYAKRVQVTHDVE